MDESSLDSQLRIAAFEFFEQAVQIHGEVLSWSFLKQGMRFHGEKVTLVQVPGIIRPRQAKYPLTIRTVEDGPYRDRISEDGYIHYAYRKGGADRAENAGLREAMRDQIPLVYLYPIDGAGYMPVWPVFIVGDNPTASEFRVMVDDHVHVASAGAIIQENSTASDVRREYLTVVTKRRLHQQSFRQRVLRAYKSQCAICRLKRPELLEAAHILRDGHPKGEPIVPNGLSLCQLHHAAFDRNLMGITPEYVIVIRRDLLEEKDGPMLLHGLQGFHQHQISTPKTESEQPSRDFLAERFEEFSKAS